jgi:hypothetical protein
MMKEFTDYQKYRWFFTSSGKLVVGGKNSVQNDELINNLLLSKDNLIVMHTSEPGSPFCAILADEDKVTKKDLIECAIFTGCFSRAWKNQKKKAQIDIFRSSQIYKSKGMKTGTWGIRTKPEKMVVELCLLLTKQEGVLRAVPESAVKSKKDSFIKICPGKIDKKDFLPKIDIELDGTFTQEEVLSALPAGGIKICKTDK